MVKSKAPRNIYYFEYYPHFLGTLVNTVKMTPTEFALLCETAKVDIDSDEFEELRVKLEKRNNATMYAINEVFYGKGKAMRIRNKVLKDGVYKGEWEEGSYAFATTLKAAKDAVRKIEAKHCNLNF